MTEQERLDAAAFGKEFRCHCDTVHQPIKTKGEAGEEIGYTCLECFTIWRYEPKDLRNHRLRVWFKERFGM